MVKKTKKDSDFKKVIEKDLKSQADEIDTLIKDTLREIRTEDNLNDYDISYRFATKSKSRMNRIVAAEISIDNVYKNANLILRPELVEIYKHHGKKEVRKILCHELAHIRVEPLAKLAYDRFVGHKEIGDAVETLTEHYGRLLNSKLDSKEAKNNNGKK